MSLGIQRNVSQNKSSEAKIVRTVVTISAAISQAQQTPLQLPSRES
jgi:hypothetical protein